MEMKETTENTIEEVQEEKRKFFNKKALKKIGIIVAGTLVTGVMMFIGAAALGASNENSEDENELTDDLDPVSDIPDETTETNEE